MEEERECDERYDAAIERLCEFTSDFSFEVDKTVGCRLAEAQEDVLGHRIDAGRTFRRLGLAVSTAGFEAAHAAPEPGREPIGVIEVEPSSNPGRLSSTLPMR